MKRAVLATALGMASAIALSTAPAGAQEPLKVGKITASSPTDVAKFDNDDIDGTPTRLLWAEDGAGFYIQSTARERGRINVLTHHHMISVEGRVTDASSEPAWARTGWAAKSDRSSPDKSSFMIDVASEKRTARGVSAPMGGEMARGGIDGGGTAGGGGGGTSSDDAINVAQGTQGVNVLMLKLGGKVIGEFVNTSVTPGSTFGWGPKGTRAIAYSNPGNGRITIMDVDGKTQELDGTGDTMLPVFSPDGTKLAWLKRDGRNKYVLQVVELR